MIKLLAAFFMLIDHIGCLLFPEVLEWRIIGRLSMPLFAYCVARGFYFCEQKGAIKKYAGRLLVFALVSQIPFGIAVGDMLRLNIGFTWLLAVILLKALTADKKTGSAIAAAIGTGVLICAASFFVDYNLYGVLFPALFYLFMFRVNKPGCSFLGMVILYLMFMLQSSMIQIFSLAAFPILLYARKYDDAVSLPKSFFYWFYPVHLIVLLIFKSLII